MTKGSQEETMTQAASHWKQSKTCETRGSIIPPAVVNDRDVERRIARRQPQHFSLPQNSTYTQSLQELYLFFLPLFVHISLLFNNISLPNNLPISQNDHVRHMSLRCLRPAWIGTLGLVPVGNEVTHANTLLCPRVTSIPIFTT
jgi:hypothetical protein